MGLLTPLEPKELKERKIIAFDTEDNSAGKVGIINFAFRIDGKIQHKTFRHPVLARKWIRSVKDRCFFVAHNLEYDLCNIYRDQDFTDIARLSYTARLVCAELEGMNASWIDSFNFFPASLKAMGKVVGLEKMDSDFESVEYCRRDTEIVLVFMEQFQKKLIEECKVGLSPTVGGLSMRAFRTNYLEHSDATYNETPALEAYFGGRCELFYKGKIGNVKVADVNSMYPDVMLEPYPDCSDLREATTWDEFYFGLSEVTIFIPKSQFIPPLPVRNDKGRLTFPVGTIRGKWCNNEIRHAVECGARVIETHWSLGTDKGEKYFYKYIRTFYAKRQASKNDFEKTFYKLFLNNLYGRWAQHNPRIEAVTTELSEKEQKKTGARLIKVLGKFYVYEIPLLEPPKTANWLWGAYVTAYARIKLHKGLLAVHNAGHLVIYCDTDSIFWSGSSNVPGLELNDKKLGAWKIEEFADGNFILPKGYILHGYPRPATEKDVEKNPGLKIGQEYREIKIACKGVPMPRALEYDDLETAENPAFRFLTEGTATITKPERLRAALARGRTPGAWYDQTKTHKTGYNRRNVGPDGITYPPVV